MAYWLSAGCLVIWLSYLMARRADHDYGVGEAPASVWLTVTFTLAATVALPSLGATTGWSMLAWCGSALASAAGLSVVNFCALQPDAHGPVADGSYPVILLPVKTAISVPDETFERVERRAAELGVSRSQFYATAAARYLHDLERSSLTAKINEALELAGEDVDESVVTSYSRQRLAADDAW